MHQITFYVPDTHLEEVKTALFQVGAGQWAGYQQCCWQTQGTGQFLAEDGSQPFIGNALTISTVSEYKVEMVCEDSLVDLVLTTLVKAHPYETPAYAAFPIKTITT